MKKVSIIIPMYNEERYIGRCLDSLKNQTFKDFEVILIDDGSKDNTIKIAETYGRDFQLRILKQNHGGPGKARNFGANEAEGDILIFVDADMCFDKDYIKFLIQPILDGKEIGTSHGTELVGNLDNPIAVGYSSVRGVVPEGSRMALYRAILKKKFLDGGGFNIKLGYADDNLSHINDGLGSYCVKNAVCYHNNPESFGEIFKHEMWVGASFTKWSVIKPYIISYKWTLIICGLLVLGGLSLLIKFSQLSLLPLLLITLLLLFFLLKIIQRNFFDAQYIGNRKKDYLLYVGPILFIRGLGVVCGWFKGLFKLY